MMTILNIGNTDGCVAHTIVDDGIHRDGHGVLGENLEHIDELFVLIPSTSNF